MIVLGVVAMGWLISYNDFITKYWHDIKINGKNLSYRYNLITGSTLGSICYQSYFTFSICLSK